MRPRQTIAHAFAPPGDQCNLEQCIGERFRNFAGNKPRGVDAHHGFVDGKARHSGVSDVFDDVYVTGFKYGFTYGNNVWKEHIVNSELQANYDGMFVPEGNRNSGEISHIDNTGIDGNGNCGFEANDVTQQWEMKGGSIDYNTSYGVCGSGVNLVANDINLENSGGPLTNLTGFSRLTLTHGLIADTKASGTDKGYLGVYDSRSIIELDNDSFYRGKGLSVTNIIDTGGLASLDACIVNQSWLGAGPSALTDATTTSCPATISSLSGGLALQNLPSGFGETVCWNPATGALGRDTSNCIPSSIAMKHDIQPLDDAEAVVRKLATDAFYYRLNGHDEYGEMPGFGAEWVMRDNSRYAEHREDGTAGVRYEQMVATAYVELARLARERDATNAKLDTFMAATAKTVAEIRSCKLAVLGRCWLP